MLTGPVELLRLLKSHEFLQRSLSDHGAGLSPRDAETLQTRLDRAFLDILTFSSDDPRVTVAQARFLLTTLAGLAGESEQNESLKEICQHHLARLEAQIAGLTLAPTPPKPAPATLASLEFRYLDSLSDRVAILDRNYRYVFTNKANGELHRLHPAAFVGRPNWDLVGDHFFEHNNKQLFDACLAGRSQSCIAAHPKGDPSTIYSASFQPIRGAGGEIDSFIVICRDVSHLRVPAELISPLPSQR